MKNTNGTVWTLQAVGSAEWGSGTNMEPRNKGKDGAVGEESRSGNGQRLPEGCAQLTTASSKWAPTCRRTAWTHWPHAHSSAQHLWAEENHPLCDHYNLRGSVFVREAP